jgi:hypothetical protein
MIAKHNRKLIALAALVVLLTLGGSLLLLRYQLSYIGYGSNATLNAMNTERVECKEFLDLFPTATTSISYATAVVSPTSYWNADLASEGIEIHATAPFVIDRWGLTTPHPGPVCVFVYKIESRTTLPGGQTQISYSAGRNFSVPQLKQLLEGTTSHKERIRKLEGVLK